MSTFPVANKSVQAWIPLQNSSVGVVAVPACIVPRGVAGLTHTAVVLASRRVARMPTLPGVVVASVSLPLTPDGCVLYVWEPLLFFQVLAAKSQSLRRPAVSTGWVEVDVTR